MASNSETFTLQLAAFAKKAKDNAETVIRRLEIDLGTAIIMRTPVGNRELWAVNIARKEKGLPGLLPKGYVGGRLRNNWVASIGAADLTTTKEFDPSGEAAIAALTATVSESDTTQDFFFTNSLPYALPIEYGHSGQAPAGMVRISVAEAQSFVDAAAASLK